MSDTHLHIYPNPDGEGFLVMQMTDQEAFAWDYEHYGNTVALENWRGTYEWRAMGRPPGLAPMEGQWG